MTRLATIALVLCAAGALARPMSDGGGTAARFTSGATTPDIRFELVTNHIYVGVRVNGSEPVTFILDSGASTIVSARCAERFGLAGAKAEGGFGAGESRVAASSAKTFRYIGAGKAVPLVLDDELAFVKATVGLPGRMPVAGLFEVDSGGGHGVILNTPFVTKYRLAPAASDGASAQGTSVGGLGGSAPVAVGALDWIDIGGLRVSEPQAILSRAKTGMLASDEFEGNVGGDVLRHFRVTFDYSRARLYLEQMAATSEKAGSLRIGAARRLPLVGAAHRIESDRITSLAQPDISGYPAGTRVRTGLVSRTSFNLAAGGDDMQSSGRLQP